MDLTIIIPTHDRNAGVVECFLAVDFLEADIVVVDDGSEEPVFLPSKTARVIRHNRHRGRAAAINTGLSAAHHDTVLIIDDDIYAAPDMVVRLVDEFAIHHNPKLGFAPRVMWDPDVPPTLTMKWMEGANKFQPPMLLWKPFVLADGGYDENFTRRLEDLELQLRLKQQGFELRTVDTAVGFQHNIIRIRDLIEREFMEGLSAVFVHSKFPDFMNIDDADALVRNENQTPDAEAAVARAVTSARGRFGTVHPSMPPLFSTRRFRRPQRYRRYESAASKFDDCCDLQSGIPSRKNWRIR